MDVLAGRKTAGRVEGQIWVGGHPKEQHSFARVCGYVEQTDIHTPRVRPLAPAAHSSIQEWYACLDLSSEVDSTCRLLGVQQDLFANSTHCCGRQTMAFNMNASYHYCSYSCTCCLVHCQHRCCCCCCWLL
jgi:hypothetical protein